MRKICLLILTLTVLLIGILPVAAQIDDEPIPCCGVFTDPSWLKIDYQRVRVDIDGQIATTNVDMQFTNEGDGLAEGTFLFPLPPEAAVEELIMYIDGEPIEAKILDAAEARNIYNEIVRQYRDPALLEYVGTNAIQANVFPIPPGDFRRIEFTYTQLLPVDNGLVHYIYPMNSDTLSTRSIGQMSVSVSVNADSTVSNIYSPSHPIAIAREDDETAFNAGWETVDYSEGEDFSLFYGLASEDISVNLLSFRESAAEDGFFMLLVQPPLTVPEDRIIPKDVIIVLDQSGSMTGEKWDQAVEATDYVLQNLKAQDRFNVILFSTGVRQYSMEMLAPEFADGASDWLAENFPEGGTNINAALTTALEMADPDRETTVLFLTDGLATEGEIEMNAILNNLDAVANESTRIFTFGVGDDVDTFLLDNIVESFSGTGSYVRPNERINEEVASLYNKISAPVLSNASLDFGGAFVELLYPNDLGDLFAGEQVTLVGRYRESIDDFTLTLEGTINGDPQVYTYDDLSLRDLAGGESFIARLWATRRIGDLLNTIRLNGESQELVDSVVSLSVRYGIITPYTSFLIEEDDILTQTGRDRAEEAFAADAEELAGVSTGAGAVDAADDIAGMRSSNAPAAASPMATQAAQAGGGFAGESDEADMAESEPMEQRHQNALTTVNDKTFILLNGTWTDTAYEPDSMETVELVFLSDAYFDLLDTVPELGDYLALGDSVIVVYEGTVYEIMPEA